MFIKRQTIRNKDGSERTYLQLVESRRINGKPRQIVMMTLGREDSPDSQDRVDQLAEAMVKASKRVKLLDLARDLEAQWSKEYGTALVFRKLWDELGLRSIITSEMTSHAAEFDVADAAFNMILNRLSDPCSKFHLEYWQNAVYGVSLYEHHQYYRALDYLIEHKDAVERRLFDCMRDLFSQKIDVMLFDTTTLAYYGEGDKGEELLAHGFSKIKRSDLKQIVVGVLMSKEGVPIGHEVFSGNTNDVTCFREVIDVISKKFKIGKVILVGDRGMISRKNIDHLKRNGYEYILGYRMRTIPKADRSQVLAKVKFKVIDKDTLHWREVSYEGQRLIVCYNPERAELDAKRREEVLGRIREKIKSGNIQSLISSAEYKRFLKIRGDAPVLDEEKVKRDELYDGIYVLTSNTTLAAGELIAAYKDLWQIEAGFRQLKTELATGPIYHWKDRRIRAHVMVCFLALIMRTALSKRLKMADKDSSYRQALGDLKALHAIGLTVAGSPVTLRTELKPAANLSFRALGMRPPNRILQSDDSADVVVRH